VLVTEQEIHDVKKFVFQLNLMKDSVVVVEGKMDANALKNIGFSGKIIEFHKFGGIVNFVDAVAKYEKLIILFDRDRKGRHLTRKTIQLLERRIKIDLSFKKKLVSITKGKVKYVEQLICYESYLA
jgi:5S rRNA maturation endonuclease (ribonuclease M5)